jgi:uncharacterized protein with ATP-grasp and redox domains
MDDLVLPPPIKGMEPNSWANDTITRRLPDIAKRVLEEDILPLSAVERLENLIQEIPTSQIRPIEDPTAPDITEWNQYVEPYLGMNWLQPPWFFSEHYFYRRVIEAVSYFQFGLSKGLDPFESEKKRGLEASRTEISDLVQRLDTWLEGSEDRQSTLRRAFYFDLWGNQADLSLWPTSGEAKPNHGDLEGAQSHLLVDDTEQVATYITNLPPTERLVTIVVDNAGFELVSDLALADFLLGSKLISRLRIHLKAHPTFVSDAIIKDVHDTLEFLLGTNDNRVRDFSERLKTHLEGGELELKDDFFWNSPLSMWDMPRRLSQELSTENLVLVKGDANYRRLLGDRHWPFTTPYGDILAYFPAPLVALRALKAELACGLEPNQAEEVASQDPQWLVNGRWGVIQFKV